MFDPVRRVAPGEVKMKSGVDVGKFDCPYCRICFPTHYRSKRGDRWVSGASNFIRHRDKCRLIWDAALYKSKVEQAIFGMRCYINQKRKK